MNSSETELADAVKELESSYDEIPYYLHSASSSHPNLLYVMARLRGIDAAHPNDCRVLDLACGRGGNLVAIAMDLPGSQCIGMDLSPRHIHDAKHLATSLGVYNVEFSQADLLGLPDGLGEFDYIFAHGVLTWVPVQVRDKIMAICASSLSDQGVACVSYATRPGYYVDLAVRDMMLYHAQNFDNREDRLEQSQQFVNLLTRVLENTDHPCAAFLSNANSSMKYMSSNFYHESLNVETLPIYFHEFMDCAGAHSLKYVCETEPEAHENRPILDRVRKELGNVPDVVRREQYKDFILNRRTRESLLCKNNLKLCLPRDPEILFELHLASAVRHVSDAPKLHNDTREGFKLPNGAITYSTNALTKKALKELGRHWPATIAFSELYQRTTAELSVAADSANQRWNLARDLLACHAQGILELRANPLNCTSDVSDKPTARPLARYFAKHNEFDQVVNQRNETLTLDKFSRTTLSLLDGTRTRGELAGCLTDLAIQGKIKIRDQGNEIDIELLPHYVAVILDKTLTKLAHGAFLLASPPD